jgi:hypothetical protein
MKSKTPGQAPADSGPAVVQMPVTAADWRLRIGELRGELTTVERSLVEKAAARRVASGQALLGLGSSQEQVSLLEDQERALEHRADALHAAIEFAEGEVRRLDNEERQARLAALRAKRAAVAADIQQHAVAVDAAFGLAADHVRAIEALLAEYRQDGGAFHRSLKATVTRGALADGLRPYLETEFVGGHEHLRPLAEQLGALAVVPGADERLADMPPAA